MSAAYNGSIDFRPAKAYFLSREKDRQARLAAQNQADLDRMERLFENRQVNTMVERDEEKIAKILSRAEKRANEEHQNLLDSRLIYSTPADFLGTSDTLIKSKQRKKFGFEK